MSGTIMLLGIDRSTQNLISEIEFFLNRTELRAVFGRTPDVDDKNMLSWGAVTIAEAKRLAMHEEHEEFRAETLDEIVELYATFPDALFSVYLCDPYRGY